MTAELEHDLALLIAKHDVPGRQFVAAALCVAEGYYEADDLPPLADVGELADALRRAFAVGVRDGR